MRHTSWRQAHIVMKHQRVPGSLKLVLALVRATSRCFAQHPQWSSIGTAGTDVSPPASAHGECRFQTVKGWFWVIYRHESMSPFYLPFRFPPSCSPFGQVRVNHHTVGGPKPAQTSSPGLNHLWHVFKQTAVLVCLWRFSVIQVILM